MTKDVSDTTEDVEVRFLSTINGTTGQNRVKVHEGLMLADGVAVPATESGWATIFVDTSDGDLKIKFGDGTVKLIVTDT